MLTTENILVEMTIPSAMARTTLALKLDDFTRIRKAKRRSRIIMRCSRPPRASAAAATQMRAPPAHPGRGWERSRAAFAQAAALVLKKSCRRAENGLTSTTEPTQAGLSCSC